MMDYTSAKIREEEYAKDPSIGSYMYFFKYKSKRWCVDATKESIYKGRLINHSALRPNLRTKVSVFKNYDWSLVFHGGFRKALASGFMIFLNVFWEKDWKVD